MGSGGQRYGVPSPESFDAETSSLVSNIWARSGRDASQQMEHLVMWVSNRDENGMELLVQGEALWLPGQ